MTTEMARVLVKIVTEVLFILFDLDKPHFAAWIELYDIDAESGEKLPSEIPSPLYYSALCGFHGLIRHTSPSNTHSM